MEDTFCNLTVADIAKDIKIKNTNFYIARAKPLFNEMQKLAKENITIYK